MGWIYLAIYIAFSYVLGYFVLRYFVWTMNKLMDTTTDYHDSEITGIFFLGSPIFVFPLTGVSMMFHVILIADQHFGCSIKQIGDWVLRDWWKKNTPED